MNFDLEMMLFVFSVSAGAVGSVCLLYLRRISAGIEEQVKLVRHIDKRVVALETKSEVFGWGAKT